MPDSGRDDGCHELLLPLDWLAMLWYISSSIFMGLVGVAAYLYYLKKGQFEDPEDVKYQMFRDEEE